MPCRLSFLSLFLTFGLLSSSAHGDYVITDLGTLGGSSSAAYGLNASGQVVGYSYVTGDSTYHAFLFTNGHMTDLGTLGGVSSVANAINNQGQIAGYADSTAGPFHAVLFDQGQIKDLGAPLGGSFGVAQGISGAGQIVGYAGLPRTSIYHPFLESAGLPPSTQDLGTLGGSVGVAYGLNDNGDVVGSSYTSNNLNHAFYFNGQMNDLGTFGGASSVAHAINTFQQIAGSADVAGNVSHAFLYSNNKLVDLGTNGRDSSEGFALNDLGDVVGMTNSSGQTVAFLYQGGLLSDLDDLLPNGSGWVLKDARGINNNGQIVGMGINPQGEAHAYLLSPQASDPPPPGSAVPEPGSFFLIVIGGIGLLLRQDRQR